MFAGSSCRLSISSPSLYFRIPSLAGHLGIAIMTGGKWIKRDVSVLFCRLTDFTLATKNGSYGSKLW